MPTPLKPEDEARIPLQLIEAVRARDAALFVGSGLSVPLGYPSWKDLVRTIHQNVESTKDRPSEADRRWIENSFASQPEWVAEAIQLGSNEAYTASLRRVFVQRVPQTPSFNHIFAALIPFSKYLTTNYDTALESHIGAFVKPGLPIYSHSDAMTNYAEYVGTNRSVLKLHGCAAKNTEDLVLTASQYYALLKDARYIRLLSHIFSSTTILVAGFSLKDRDFRLFLEERHHLYNRRSPPLYALIPEDETCRLEMDLFSNKYNVTLLPISRKDNFAELTSFLYSLYCLVYREDSSRIGERIALLAASKAHEESLSHFCITVDRSSQLSRALNLLACFHDPLPLDLYVSLLLENAIHVSAAELLTSVSQDVSGRIFTRRQLTPTESDLRVVSKWIASELAGIPVLGARRHFSTYQKEVFHRYENTLAFLLETPAGWTELIGNDTECQQRFVRLNQFFRQEGQWGKWLKLAESAMRFLENSNPVYRPLLQSVLWVYFWTRRFKEAQDLIQMHQNLDDSSGEHNYADRIRYIDRSHLQSLVVDLEARPELDYFAMSLLGRSHAQLSLGAAAPAEHLCEARRWLTLAKSEATTLGDWIERAVQSWYLAIVLADLGETHLAKQELAEVRRLDEVIMNRIPGIAWLHLAEYRLSVRDNGASEFRVTELRNAALQAFQKLGTVDAPYYIEREYFY